MTIIRTTNRHQSYTTMMSNAFAAGLAAAKAGLSFSDNPYKRFETRTSWQNGYERGMKAESDPPERASMSRRYTYQRMTPEQLSAALDQLKLTKWQFIRLSGLSHQKVERMLTGEADIPHETAVLLSVLTLPGAMDRALAVTNALIVKEED